VEGGSRKGGWRIGGENGGREGMEDERNEVGGREGWMKDEYGGMERSR
jgi:hypothetical protein